jgi:type VI secretion system protein VasD
MADNPPPARIASPPGQRSHDSGSRARRTCAFLVIVCPLLLAGVAGCKLFGPKPTVAQIDLRAQQNLNPDDTGRASPLRVRLYELKSVSAFNGADFFALYEHDKEILAADIVVREEIQVEPGMQKTLTRRPAPDTKFLAVFAAYRDFEHARWRASMELPPNKTTSIVLQLDAVAVTLSPASKK